MRKIITIILCIICCVLSFAGCSNNDKPNDDTSNDKFTITYYSVIDGVKGELPSDALVEGVSYPTEYTQGTVVIMENLKPYFKVVTDSGNYEIIFDGWFIDSECQTEFKAIDADTVGNIIIYAKMSKRMLTQNITYKCVINGEIVDLSAEFMRENGKYPLAYNEGEGDVLIDDLKEETYICDIRYRFVDWYTTPTFEKEFAGITPETTGNIIIYAKIIKDVWGPYV